MTIVKALYDYFDKCDLLASDRSIGVNQLDEEVKNYSIETVPCKPDIKQYRDGSAKKQYIFNFSGREFYGDSLINLANSSFYENLSEWIAAQSWNGNLPDLPDGCTAQEIAVTSNGYVMDNDTKTARYQIQCKLTYFQEAIK